MEIDCAKAKLVLDRLYDTYIEKLYPYDLPEALPPQAKVNLPQSFLWGSKEHACFLFTLCYWMRGGIDSHTATHLLTKVYSLNPNLFNPEFGFTMKPESMAFIFKIMGLGFNAIEIAAMWKKNWQKVYTEWGGDPRNLFKGISTYEEACGRIQNNDPRRNSGFKGFQEKMVSMLTYFYMDAGIVDRWHFPIPVDFHVLRTMFANEIVLAEVRDANANGYYTKEVLHAVRELLMWYCKEYKKDPLLLCEAVWLYSRIMCSNHPGNRSAVGGRQGRKTPVYAAKTWSRAQTRTYERTCGVCVIDKTCRWCVPSAEYYIRGRIVLRERRDTPSQKTLFQINT